MPDAMSRRKFLKAAAISIVGLGVPAAASGVYAIQIEPEAVEVTHLTIRLPNLPSVFDGITIVQVSDLHIGGWMTPDRMLDLVPQINALQPDILALTGDFVLGTRIANAAAVGPVLSQLVAREGIFAVLGNHDYWLAQPTAMRKALADAGNVHLLRNAHIPLDRNGDTLYIAGLDDAWNRRQDIAKALDGIPDGSAVVLLAHEPDTADVNSKHKQIGLQLSGHTHGGQVRLPGVGALKLPYLGKKYDMGLYHINGMALYVTRGVGMIKPYVRFNCRPEITHITLRA